MNTDRLRSLLVLLVGCLITGSALAHEITHYEVTDLDCQELETGRVLRAFRSLHFDGLPRLLVVDAETFATDLIDPKYVDCTDPAISAEIALSPFGLALTQSASAPFPTRNDGITHAAHAVNGLFLTADLCPASKEIFEYRLFDALEAISDHTGASVPIALAVSGKWIRQHELDFEEILKLIQARKIDVTWVNHSDSHPYHRGERVQDNFLLESGINPDQEIEGVERALLSQGEIPSPFFRFPGLISNQKWIEALKTHSLIPIGSDAWLALQEKPKSGSIILIHANGNEPEGVTQFLKSLPEIEAIGPFLPLSALF